MLKAIKSEKQYKNTLARVYELMQQKIHVGSKQFMELEILSALIAVYEMTHGPIPKSI